MTTQAYYNTQQGFVKEMRRIRDGISNEIKDMTFKQKRIYLDKLLKDNETDNTENRLANRRDDQ